MVYTQGVYQWCIPGRLPREATCPPYYPMYTHHTHPGIYHPVYLRVHHATCCTWTGVHSIHPARAVPSVRALGSEGKNPLGREPLLTSWSLRCERPCASLRRVTPVFLRERTERSDRRRVNYRIYPRVRDMWAKGVPSSGHPIVAGKAQRCASALYPVEGKCQLCP